MAHVVFAWELGANLGHVGAFRELGRELLSRGHRLSLVVQDPGAAQTFFGGEPVAILQAPFWRPRGRKLTPVSYADQLYVIGYDSERDLAALITAWGELFRALGPDLIVFDAAPTALLASRALQVPRVILDNPFSSPPPITPLPPLGDLSDPARRRRYSVVEAEILDVVRRACTLSGVPPVETLRELFMVERTFLRSIPALDPYAPRTGSAVYVGAPASLDSGEVADWPEGEGPRIFAYLRPASRWFPELSRQLSGVQARWVIAAPGLDRDKVDQLSGPGRRVHPGPVRLGRLLEGASLLVGHGGASTTGAFLRAGVPALILPNQFEQQLTASRVEQEGLGLSAPLPLGRLDLGGLVEGALSPAIRQRVRAFAKDSSQLPCGQQGPLIASEIERVLAG